MPAPHAAILKLIQSQMSMVSQWEWRKMPQSGRGEGMAWEAHSFNLSEWKVIVFVVVVCFGWDF